MEAGKIGFLSFTATWCGPCRAMKPTIEELKKEYDNVNFTSYDIEESEAITQEFNITSVPTFIITNNGQIKEIVKGAKTKTYLKNLLDKQIG